MLMSQIASFKEIEAQHPELVAIDSQGHMTGNVMDFCEFQQALPGPYPDKTSPMGTSRDVQHVQSI